MNIEQSAGCDRPAPSRLKKIFAVIGAVIVLFALIGVGVRVMLDKGIRPSKAYDAAEELYLSGSYDEAATAFDALGDYKDSAARAAQCWDELGLYFLGRQDYINLNSHILRHGLTDSVREALLTSALEEIELGRYDEVCTLLCDLTAAADIRDTITEALYQKSLIHYNGGDFEVSDKLFAFLGGYKDSRNLIHIHEYTLTAETAPTCIEPGLSVSVCQCGAAETRNIDPLGHEYSDGSCRKAPVCRRCGQEGDPALGHDPVDAICSECGKVILTLEQLQGSWFHSEGFARIIISGDQATVIRYSVGITYSGTVQFRDDGFIVEGDYYHLDSDDTTPAGKAKATFIITKFTESYFVDAFDDRGPYTWYRE